MYTSLAVSQAVIDSLNNQLKLLSLQNQKIAENKKMVADFYQVLFGDKNIDAIDKYIGATYIQHYPMLPGGKEFLKEGAKTWFKGLPYSYFLCIFAPQNPTDEIMVLR